MAARSIELVAAGVAEADAGRLRECGRVEPRPCRADLVGDRVVAGEVREVCVGCWALLLAMCRWRRAIIVNGLPLNAPYTPFICQSLARALPMPPYPLLALPRQRVDEPELQVVPAIEAGRAPVAPQLARRVEPRFVAPSKSFSFIAFDSV